MPRIRALKRPDGELKIYDGYITVAQLRVIKFAWHLTRPIREVRG